MQILYKYLASDRVDVLDNRRIRFTQPGAFNDPWEAYPSLQSYLNASGVSALMSEVEAGVQSGAFSEQLEAQIEQELENLGVQLPVSAEIKAQWKEEALRRTPEFTKLAMSLMPKMFGSATSETRAHFAEMTLAALDSRVGVLCLSEDPTNLLMWAHYASSHKGFAIGFNKEHEFFDQRGSKDDLIRQLKRVHYSAHRPEFSGFSGPPTEAEVAQLADLTLLTKADVWSHEREWRMIRDLESGHEVTVAGAHGVYLFDYPITAVAELILGCRVEQATRQALERTLSSDDARHIAVFQARRDESEFGLVLERVA